MKKTLSQNEKKICEYLIKLLASAVNQTKVPVPYEGINWSHLYSYAKQCSVSSIMANTILSLPKDFLPEQDILNKLRNEINMQILIDSNISYETEKLLRTFEEYKLKNLPLKGYFMKMEYPRSDFRSVSDVDILFDRNEVELLRKACESAGYEFLHNDESQYHFRKAPYMYVEMHAELSRKCDFYHNDIRNQLDNSYKREGYEYSYNMSIEDYYVFMLLHNSTHFRIGGMGIRMMLDTYVFYRNHHNEFDYDYLNKRLQVFRLEKFEEKVRTLAYRWFSSTKPEMKFDDFEIYILLSATLGRVDAGVMISSHKNIKKAESEGRKCSKFSYLIKSVCPNKTKMQVDYPYLKKYPFLLPYTWVCMWCRRFFIDKNASIKRGLKNRFSYTDEDVNYFKGVLNEVGFDDFN